MTEAYITLSNGRKFPLVSMSDKAREIARVRPKALETPVGYDHEDCYTYRIAGPSSADPRRRCYDHQVVYLPKFGKG